MWREVSGRLAGQEGSEILRRIVGLEPGGLINGPGELGGVALTEAIADKVGYGLEDPFRISTGFSASQGASQKAFAHGRHLARSACVGHRAAKIIRFRIGEASEGMRNYENLFLEEQDTLAVS
jgi:hypothetical protein